MATWLRQSTSTDVPIGPFLDETTGKDAETTLTITQPDIRLKKNGGAWAQKNAAQTLTHEENGWYELTLDATDTNTLGILVVAVHESGALPVWNEYLVVPAQVWDSYLGADLLDVSVAQWLGTAAATPTVAGVPEVDVTHYAGTGATATGGRPEVNVSHWRGTAAPAEHTAGYPVVTIKDGTGTGELDTALGVVLAKDHAGANLATAAALTTVDDFLDTEIADIQARLPAALVSGRMSSDVVAISGDTAAADNLEAEFDGTGYQANIRRAVAQAGAAGTITLDASASATDDVYNGLLVSIVSGTGVGQARLITDYVGSTKVATISPNWVTNPASGSVFVLEPWGRVDTALWLGVAPNALVSGRVDSSTGAMATDVLTDTALAASAVTEIQTGLATAAAQATLQADTDDIQTRLPAALVGGRMDASVGALAGVVQSATDLKDFADDGYDPGTNKVQGVVLVDTVTTYTGNTPQTGDSFARLGAPAGVSVSADIAAIEAQTDDIGVAGAGLTAVPWNAAWDAEVQSEVADALGVYDPPTHAEMTAEHDTLPTAAETADAVWAKTMTELTAVPGVTATALAALTWCFELARNRITQTATVQTVLKDDGTTTLATSTHSDDGTTHIRGEFA